MISCPAAIRCGSATTTSPTNSLRYRLFDERPFFAAGLTVQEAESLLLWGGTDTDGAPFLNPAFVINAPTRLPEIAGEHRISGRTASGDELFGLDFAVPEVAYGDGGSSCAFVLPVQPNWADNLDHHTLRARWLDQVRQRYGPSDDDPARSNRGTGEGHPARLAASGRGGTRASGASRQSRRVLQPWDSRCHALGPPKISHAGIDWTEIPADPFQILARLPCDADAPSFGSRRSRYWSSSQPCPCS